ncbi:hypothetical protein C2E23DRAFT_713787, partial [Lenzites betulinus]
LRASNLNGIEVPGLTERIITTMFADDTTVFLSANDSYSHMRTLLDRWWCKGSRAKFNEPKTVLIPLGPRAGRERIRRDRTLAEGTERLPGGIRILDEGEGTRMLGAWIGPDHDDATPWTSVVNTIQRNLERWSRRRPTLKGKQVIVNLEVGSRTQYLARVQGMPKEIEKSLEKMISKFLWDGKRVAVAGATMGRPVDEGGLKILNIAARNEPIDLMWLRSYLDLSGLRPRWAHLADALIAKAILASERRVAPTARVNIFLQTWNTNTSILAGMPRDLARMLKAAKRYGVALDAQNPSNDLAEALPVWYH